MKYFNLLFSFSVFSLLFGTSFAASCPEINRSDHPNGLGYPAFNCFIDNYWLGDNVGGDKREQNFLRVDKNYQDNWSDNVSITSQDDVLRVFLYAHNSGEENKYPANDVKIEFDWSGLPTIKGEITANNTNPVTVNDTASISVSNGLKLVPQAIWYKDYKIDDINPGATKKTIANSILQSSYVNAAWFFVTFTVEKDLPPAPSCNSASFDPNPVNINGSTTLTVNHTNATEARYSCNNGFGSGSLNLSTGKTFSNVGKDFSCSVTVENETGSDTCTDTAAVKVVDNRPPECHAAVFNPNTIEPGGSTNLSVDQSRATSATYSCSGGITDQDQPLDLTNGKDFSNILSDARCTVEVKNNYGKAVCDPSLTFLNIKDPVCQQSSFSDDHPFPGDEVTFSWDLANFPSTGKRQIVCKGNAASDFSQDITNSQGLTVFNINSNASTGSQFSCHVEINNVKYCAEKLTVQKDDRTPSIKIDKNDADNSDDTQTIDAGKTAHFTITVTNPGPVDLKLINIVDGEAQKCALSQAELTKILTDTDLSGIDDISDISREGLQNNDDILQVGESFSYKCKEENVLEGRFTDSPPELETPVDNNEPDNYILINAVDSNDDSKTVSDDDTTTVLVGNAGKPGVSVYKVDLNEQEDVEHLFDEKRAIDNHIIGGNEADFTDPLNRDNPDKTQFDYNDSQTIYRTGNARFKIRVTNTGAVPLENVVLQDITSDGHELSDCEFNAFSSGLEQIGDELQQELEEAGLWAAILAVFSTDTYSFDPQEYFEFICTDTNVSNGYINQIFVTAESKVDGTQVASGDATEVIVKDPTLDPKCTSSFDITNPKQGQTTTFSWILEELPNNTQLVCKSNISGLDINGDYPKNMTEKTGSEVFTIPNTAKEGETISCKVVVDDQEYCQQTIVVGNGGDSGGKNPEINLIKHALNSNDQDEDKSDAPSNDSQKIDKGSEAIFRIIVENTGNVALNGVYISDPKAPDCVKNSTEALALIQSVGNQDSLLDPGEIFTYTCKHEGETQNYTNVAEVNASRADTGAAISPFFDGSNVVFDGDGDGGGGGGGGSETVSSIGVCSFSGNGGLTCAGRKPVFGGEQWEEYLDCKNNNGGFWGVSPSGTQTLEQACVLEWSQKVGITNTCGSLGNPLDYKNLPQTDINTQCGYFEPPPPTDCDKVCIGCFENTITRPVVHKSVKNSLEPYFKQTTTAPMGDPTEFEIKVDISGTNNPSDYKIIGGYIELYDAVIPSDSGDIWKRKIDVLPSGWTEISGNDDNNNTPYKFKYTFSATDISSGNLTTNPLRYISSVGLKADKNSAENLEKVKNNAFARVYYEYVTYDHVNSTWDYENPSMVIITSDDTNSGELCNGIDSADLSSLGVSASVAVIRPYTQSSNGGNLGFNYVNGQTDLLTNTSRTDTNGRIFNDGTSGTTTVFQNNGKTTNDVTFEEYRDFSSNNRSDLYANLKLNAVSASDTPFGIYDLKKSNNNSGIYIYPNGLGDINLSGLNNDLGGKSITILIEKADVNIDNNFKVQNGFVSFVLEEGDLNLASSITDIDGIYIVEKGNITSTGVNYTSPLKVNGLLNGNMKILLDGRRYIGSNPDVTVEPAIEVNLDLRIWDQTPPGLEMFLGQNWQEGLLE